MYPSKTNPGPAAISRGTGPAAISRGSSTKCILTKRTQRPLQGRWLQARHRAAAGISNLLMTKQTQAARIANQFITKRTQANRPVHKFQIIFIYERTQQLVDNTQNAAIPNLRYSGDSNA
jgi:hypothetical protein